jgi:hypothetical protein
VAASADEAGLQAPVVFEVVADLPLLVVRHDQPFNAPWVRPSVKRLWVRM